MAGIAIDGIGRRQLARRWGIEHCHVFGRVTSTLDSVHELGARGAPGGTIVIADEQTAGRGREGRTWRSPPGGVWLALLLRPPCPAPGVLSLRVGLVLADIVDEIVGGPRVQLKWPNDVLVDGRKLAGVLSEARWQGDVLQWMGVGIGINVANAIPAELAGRALALRALCPAVRRLDVLDRLIPPLRRLAAHGARLTDLECAAFAGRDWLRGRQLRAPLAGRAAGVGADGALLVETADGVGVVRDGHVELS